MVLSSLCSEGPPDYFNQALEVDTRVIPQEVLAVKNMILMTKI